MYPCIYPLLWELPTSLFFYLKAIQFSCGCRICQIIYNHWLQAISSCPNGHQDIYCWYKRTSKRLKPLLHYATKGVCIYSLIQQYMYSNKWKIYSKKVMGPLQLFNNYTLAPHITDFFWKHALNVTTQTRENIYLVFKFTILPILFSNSSYYLVLYKYVYIYKLIFWYTKD